MPELQPGDPRRLGSYELLERLGEGGQGVVYLGRDESGTKVAVKLLRPDLTEDTAARTRFVREVQAGKQVARFCTAQLIEADMAGDRPYIVSEFVPGVSLQKLVATEGLRSGAALDRLAIGTVTALVAIHQAGIVHRDFKPHNVLMAPDGPRVIDFGIARALDAGTTAVTKAIGTPSYMAPEQVMGQTLTEAVDIFAWASTMVYAATGQPPFGQDSIPAVINRILNEEPDLAGVPEDLRPVLVDCLAKDPGRRPTAQALMMRLIGGGTGAPVDAPTRLDPAVPMAAATGELPTAVLAEGEHMAGRTAVAGGPYGTSTLPGVPGHPGTAPPPGRTGGKGPLIGAIAAVAAILLLVGGLVYALGRDSGGGGAETPAPTQTTQTVTQQPEGSAPPQEPTEQPTQQPTEEPTQEPTQEPTEEPTEPGTSTPPSDDETGGGDTGDGGDGGGGGSGGSSPGTGGGGTPGTGGQEAAPSS